MAGELIVAQEIINRIGRQRFKCPCGSTRHNFLLTATFTFAGSKFIKVKYFIHCNNCGEKFFREVNPHERQ